MDDNCHDKRNKMFKDLGDFKTIQFIELNSPLFQETQSYKNASIVWCVIGQDGITPHSDSEPDFSGFKQAIDCFFLFLIYAGSIKM